MCGIIAIARRRGDRLAPTAAEIDGLLAPAEQAARSLSIDSMIGGLQAVAEGFEAASRLLYGPPGALALADVALSDDLEQRCLVVSSALIQAEHDLDAAHLPLEQGAEAANAALIRAKDAVWAVERDRLRTGREVARFGAGTARPAIEAFCSVQQALSALDRLEVRGRDSAGLQLLVDRHGLDLEAPSVVAAIEERQDPLLRSGTVQRVGSQVSFVYKAAAEIGELGDNTAALRAAIAGDELFRQAISSPDAQVLVLGHTRWASVGIISEPNAHPLNSRESTSRGDDNLVFGVLNGDVDNYGDLVADEELDLAAEITTDAKVIPTLTGRRIAEGYSADEAFRRTVASLEGSLAIGCTVSGEPESLWLSLRGSGQALYVGLAEDCFIVASEPYGVVEDTDRFIRMDGDTPANSENPTGSRGQILRLDARRAGELAGISRRAYDDSPIPLHESDLVRAEITTRDIDRGTYPHYLLKELSESPGSFRKTLRGRLVESPDGLRVDLGPDVLPAEVRAQVRERVIDRVVVIGQGTAHIAGMSLAQILAELAPSLRVEATPATEYSGFRMRADMSDTLVVAISQSGTTTDTNRTVDLVRDRGAHVVSIVNRRNSDLTDKSDGVLYTSDGRDVEMSVASTKAFYSQVAAGFLLAHALAGEAERTPPPEDLLRALREVPDAMERVLLLRPIVATAARELAPSRRYWALVGNGPNVVAAREIRIKLSELCYKSIASDITEDKKHIDLSSEPLIIVCAAGLSGSTADDVAKEVAIFRAHKAAPVVIATEGEERFSAALHAVLVPEVHPRLAFVLSAMVGHLFGYEAALAIDALALPLREARAAIETVAGSGLSGEKALAQLRADFGAPAARFFDDLRAGEYNGHLEASTATRLASLFRYALGQVPLDSYQIEYGKVGTPGSVIDDFTAALTWGIEELTRPIDAIKHQAKTVTVGISRSDETLLQIPLVAELIASGAPRDRLSYETLRVLADIDPVVDAVLGYTRYRIEGDVHAGAGSAVVIDQGGVARSLPSRTDANPVLRGTKNRVAAERRVLVAQGRADGRSIVIVPEVKDAVTTGLTLLHVRFDAQPSLAAVRGALQGYRNRYSALRDAVTETEPTFREDLLTTLPVLSLLADSIYELADEWRT